jgi:hypothetical protein
LIAIPEDRCERHRLFERIDAAFKAGDFTALGEALGGADRWFDESMPFEFGLGHPLEYAIYWSPLAFVEQLIAAGSRVNYADAAGFPSLIAALSTKRPDRLRLTSLLIRQGADLHQRGVNDWTPLHYAVALRDADAIALLMEAGADPNVPTRIDDCTSALEEAEAGGFEAGAALMRPRPVSRRRRRAGRPPKASRDKIR